MTQGSLANPDGSQGLRRDDPLHALLDIAERMIVVGDLVRGHVLYAVDPEEPTIRAAAKLEQMGFDVAPLAETPITKFVDRSWLTASTGPIREHARPIDPSILVAANLPLSDALTLLHDSPALFVFDRHEVLAVFTRADLQLPVVTLFALGLITAAEAALDELIERYSDRAWQKYLSPNRLKGVREIFALRQATNAEIDLVRCLNIDDRLTLVQKIPGLVAALEFQSVTRFCRWIKPVKKLRNALAHGGNLLSAEPDPIKAIELLQEVRRFAELAWERVHDDAQLWGRFARTIMSLTIDGREVQISGPGAGPWPFDDEDCWVITACNPMGRIESANRNARANEELEKDLSEAGGVVLPAVGRSGDWLEQSFVVRGLGRDAVLALAHSYSQRAVFRLAPACVEVVECPEGEVKAETVRDWRPLP